MDVRVPLLCLTLEGRVDVLGVSVPRVVPYCDVWGCVGREVLV